MTAPQRSVRPTRGRSREISTGQEAAAETRVPGTRGNDHPGSGSPAWTRLEDQIAWYSAKGRYNQRWFKLLKVCQIIAAAVIPVAAAESAPAWLISGLGALILVLEGLQQLQQYQQNWATYRSTCERLKHEKFLFLARAGPYAAARSPEPMLAERVEGLVSQEHAAWAAHQEEQTRGAKEG